MGVDAMMFFKTKNKQNEQKLSYELGCMFNSQLTHGFDDLKSHSITDVEKDGYKSEILNNYYIQGNEYMYEIHLWGRYYGPGYERGDILTYINIAEWLEWKLGPNITIYYGGDSSDNYQTFGKEERRTLREYYFENAHRPYQSCSRFKEQVGNPMCARCYEPMFNTGGGGAETYWCCHGCNYKALTSSGKIVKWWTDHSDFFETHEEFRNEQKGIKSATE
jgi:hypothetical protein